MLIVTKIEELKDILFRIRSNSKSVGLVPTMGALHNGHLSLLQRAKKENEVVVCSIFVNPVQFNNAEDLEKYPRSLEQDVRFVDGFADIVFAPNADEVFPEAPKEHYNFGNLETVMEGACRLGHFNGVAIIVKRLLDWVVPDKAYFGEKDYQQLVIIKNLVKQANLKVQIVPCPIVREESGLALSSRNKRLTEEERILAAKIHQIMLASTLSEELNIEKAKQYVIDEIGKIDSFRLDYYEIVDDSTLQKVEFQELSKGIIGCIAVYIRNIRLIDNIRYK